MTAIVTLPRRELAAAVRWAAAGIPRDPGLPILAAVRETRRVTCDGDGDGYAEALTDGKALSKALAGLPGGKQAATPVTLTAGAPGGGHLDITSAGMTVSPAATGPDQQYPPVPLVNGPAGQPTDPAGFAGVAAAAAACAATSSAYPALTAVQVTATGGQLVLIATDRRHLYRAATGWDGPDITPMLLPARPLASFLAAAGGGPVTIRAEQPRPGNVIPIRETPPAAVKWRAGPWAEISAGTRALTVRAVTGRHEFPDITHLIRPSDRNDTLIAVDAAALAAATGRAVKVAGDHGTLRIAASSPAEVSVHVVGGRNDDRTTERIPAAVEGPPAVIHVTTSHLPHMLARATGAIRLGITSDRSAVAGRPPVPQAVMVYGAGWLGGIQADHNPRHHAGNPDKPARPLAVIAELPQQPAQQGETE